MSGAAGLFEEEEEHENHERYLITYADMITLLLALFIILFSIGQTDLAKFARLKEGLAAEFGNPALEGGPGILDGARSSTPPKQPVVTPITAPTAGGAGPGGIGQRVDAGEEAAETKALLALRDRLGWSSEEFHVKVDARGVVIVLDTDNVTFASASWELEPRGKEVLTALFGPLGDIDNELILEGHTDDRPMSGNLTNWELSANRAGAAVRFLIGNLGVDPQRLSAAGYADTRPVQSNATEEGRRANRRVEIVIRVDPDASTGNGSRLATGRQGARQPDR
jgi:chemotaxis protein MotB